MEGKFRKELVYQSLQRLVSSDLLTPYLPTL
jgi:hypothetical protein